MTSYHELQERLRQSPRTWLVTGAAGFIGSHLVETLLNLGQTVTGLDNFASGHGANLDHVKAAVGEAASARFRFIEGSITDPETCATACAGADFVLHQAALGSVSRSIDDPLSSHDSNVTGMLNMLEAARHAGVKRFVYASSCAVYGDSPKLPMVETEIGNPLSPYAATKRIDEIYANVFARAYGLESIGLRYFNIFGPRQDPEGAYAAVIPKWVAAILQGEPIRINGTGETSRDFCYIANTVQANLLAATTENENAINEVFNVALHEQTSLNELYKLICNLLLARDSSLAIPDPVRGEFRHGDVMHSLADIKKARNLLGFQPTVTVRDGLETTVNWFWKSITASA